MEVNYEAKVFTFETNVQFEIYDSKIPNPDDSFYMLVGSDASSSETISFDSDAMFKITAFTIAFPIQIVSSDASNPFSLTYFQGQAIESRLLINDAPLSFSSETNLMPYGIYVPSGADVSAVTRRITTGNIGEQGNYELKLRYSVFGILETQS